MAKRKKKINSKALYTWIQVCLGVLQGLKLLRVIPLLLLLVGGWVGLNTLKGIPGGIADDIRSGLNKKKAALKPGEKYKIGPGSIKRYDKDGKLLSNDDLPPGSSVEIGDDTSAKLIRHGFAVDPAVAMTYSGGGFRAAGGVRLFFWGRIEQEDLVNDRRFFAGLSHRFKMPLLRNCSIGGGYSIALPFLQLEKPEGSGPYGSFKVYLGSSK